MSTTQLQPQLLTDLLPYLGSCRRPAPILFLPSQPLSPNPAWRHHLASSLDLALPCFAYLASSSPHDTSFLPGPLRHLASSFLTLLFRGYICHCRVRFLLCQLQQLSVPGAFSFPINHPVNPDSTSPLDFRRQIYFYTSTTMAPQGSGGSLQERLLALAQTLQCKLSPRFPHYLWASSPSSCIAGHG